MKVLLINPPLREEVPPVMFPLGMAYLVTCLKRAKHKPVVVDIDGNRYFYERALKLIKKHLEEGDIGAIGTGGLITVYKYCKRLVKDIRKIDLKIPIVIGGSLATSSPNLVMEKIKPDYLVLREGEISFINLINCLEKQENPKTVKGIVFKSRNKLIFTPPEELASAEFLDNLLPDWDAFPVEKYISYPNIACGMKRSISVSTMRGCPFNCRFCYHIFERRTRFRSPESVINEIKILKKRYRIRHILFSDDLFTVNRKNVEKFCDLIIQQKIDISWSAGGRVDTVDIELLKKMKKAGCTSFGYGFESGSQKILDLMNKRTTVEQARKAAKMTRNAGLVLQEAFMIGFPGETRETFEETIKFCIENDMPTYFSFTCPYPGTDIFYSEKIAERMDLEEFVEKIGEQTALTINLTDMSDEELIEMCDEGEKRIARAYISKNFPINIFLYPLLFLGVKKYASAIKQCKTYGLLMFLLVNTYYQLYELRRKLESKSIRG